MPRDTETSAFQLQIKVVVIPVNRYGDSLSELEGEFSWTKNIKVKNLSEAIQALENAGTQIPRAV